MFKVLDLADSIKNLIDKNNVATSDYYVSLDMNTAVQKTVVGFHVNKPLPNILYPCVWVEPVGTVEKFGELGNTGKRNIEIDFNIVSVTNYGFGLDDGREESGRESIVLTDNLKYLFRNYPRLSCTSYVLKSTVSGTDYDVEEYNGTYNSISKIKLTVDVRSV
jgi:hypothetical protein